LSNSIDSDRLWNLDTVAVIAAVGVPVIVRKVVFIPTTVDDDAAIQEYDAAGALRDAIIIKASHLDIGPVQLDFGPTGRLLNGFKLSVIDHGNVHVYLGRD
jgi:hypothetical protein